MIRGAIRATTKKSNYTYYMLTSTRFQKSKKDPKDFTVLKPGKNNKKLGFVVKKSKWKNKLLYSLTLIERETCPKSCHHWDDCYGNQMPFAHRFKTEGLMQKVKLEIDQLLKKHKQGIIIRLHVLGDFYSVEYVKFWGEMLAKHKKLCIFGYTAREHNSAIGKELRKLNTKFKNQCVIRKSGEPEENSDWTYAVKEESTSKSFLCPEQSSKVSSCSDCAACWVSTKSVKFMSH